MTPIYSLRDVEKSRLAEGAGFRLRVPKVDILPREHVALVGHSGCGKSTLLDMLALVLHPDEAERFEMRTDAEAEPVDVHELWQKKRQNRLSLLRKQHIGYVLQQGGLLPYLSVRENIELPRQLLGLPEDDTVKSISRVMGIHRQLDKLPGLLSAGERQRVAFARALAHRPKILLADEPTASLDPITARKIMGVVMELVKGLDITLIIASHDWAHVYKMDLRSLHQEAEVVEGGKVYQSTFHD